MTDTNSRRPLPSRRRNAAPSPETENNEKSTMQGGKTSFTKPTKLIEPTLPEQDNDGMDQTSNALPRNEDIFEHGRLEDNNKRKRSRRRSFSEEGRVRKSRKLSKKRAESEEDNVHKNSLMNDSLGSELLPYDRNYDQSTMISEKDGRDEIGNASDTDVSFHLQSSKRGLLAILPSSSTEIAVRVRLSLEAGGVLESPSTSTSKTSRSSNPKSIPEPRVQPVRRSRAPPDMLDTSPILFQPYSGFMNKQKKSQKSQDITEGEKKINEKSNGTSRARAGKVDEDETKESIEKVLVPEVRRSRRRNTPTDLTTYIGDDGNLFFCNYCKEVGEVVCCDGCPRVFHPTCIPKGISRTSLDNDDDPWYCPFCHEQEAKKHTKTTKNTVKINKHVDRMPINEESIDIEPREVPPIQTRKKRDRRLDQIDANKKCGEKRLELENTPSGCIDSNDKNAIEIEIKEEKSTADKPKTKNAGAKVSKGDKKGKVRKLLSRNHPSLPIPNDEKGSKTEKYEDKVSSTTNRKRKTEKEESIKNIEKKQTSKKTKLTHVNNKKINKEKPIKKSDLSPKKERRREKRIPTTIVAPKIPRSPMYRPKKARRPVTLTPAFFFFLSDVRHKIEKHLLRRISKFKSLSKSLERNHIIAKEGALWWEKLDRKEKQNWANRAVKDFEERVIEWKEDTIVQQMKAQGSIDSDIDVDEDRLNYTSRGEKSNESSRMHKNDLLVKSAIIPSDEKPLSTSTHFANTTLLNLLQDLRFHPLSMIHPSRQRCDIESIDYSNTTVPQFEVKGPIKVHIGDECMGCARGWCHYCPILKCQLPAVELRSKLQPALSSLTCTRVGVDVHTDHPVYESDEVEMEGHQSDLNLTLTKPKTRIDHISRFVEAVSAINLSSTTTRLKGMVPGERSSTNNVDDDHNTLFVCGGCGVTISSNLGCISCRRLLLKKEMSILQSSVGKGDRFLKLQSVMLGRSVSRGSNFSIQREGDKRIATALTTPNWKPHAIMPNCKPEPLPRSCKKINDKNTKKDIKESVVQSETDLNSPINLSVERKRPRVTILDRSSSLGSDSFTKDKLPARRTSRRHTSNFNNGNMRISSEGIGSHNQKNIPDVQELAQAHKVEATHLNRKCLSFAIAGSLLGLMRRDHLRLFAEPVPSSVEDYHKIVSYPMDFKTMRQKTLNGEYSSFGAFALDVKQLCNNALAFNPPGSIYSDTAQEISSLFETVHRRASEWLLAIKNAHASSFTKVRWGAAAGGFEEQEKDSKTSMNGKESHYPYKDLRKSWPDGVQVLENGSVFLSQINADFMRTKENEGAYYGALALRRVAIAAAICDGSLEYLSETDRSCISRSAEQDEDLRKRIDSEVSKLVDPLTLLREPSWKEKKIQLLLRYVQKRKVECYLASESGCARCDGASLEEKAKLVVKAEARRLNKKVKKSRKKNSLIIPGNMTRNSRIVTSRLKLCSGLGSRNNLEKSSDKVKNSNIESSKEEVAVPTLNGVSIDGSQIHGWGLFADHSFKSGEIVAEYVGEYVRNPIADKREKMYQDRRIQDYQFRVADNLVIDATLNGGYARYINHNCNPNCIAKIVEGDAPNEHLKRVMIISQRDIVAGEEITYDYQFPLELNLSERIPCNCGSDDCRSFMNWDLPEKGKKVTQK